ncbi:hypothetical protein [Senegalimassilia faecalis]|uniref:hypothetical protein n=1 Tax=Senegalimassilia faecalis TaxID=2509433 RepID=UPI003A97DE25
MRCFSKLISFVAIALLMLACIAGCSAQNDEDVQSTISAIDAIGEVSLDSDSSIYNAEAKYEALTDRQKKAVSNYDTLVAARNSYNNLIEAEMAKVEKAISGIGEVTLEKASIIDDANSLYQSLPNDAKEQVSNYDVLQSALDTIADLKKKHDEEVKALEKQKAEEAKALSVGDTVSTNQWNITLADAYTSATLESSQSRTSWTASDGSTFLILEFDVEALTSDKLTIDSSAITNIVASYNNNTYKTFDMKYLASELWLSAKRTYLDANIPVHVYVYAALPASALDDEQPINVDLAVAGQDKHLNVR